ncbi:hypothetical protein FQN54_009007 [Arachnomyces sp. PD_36]|nr:hypothetical protein FQN54_009007 [Arachnomyces sp. PD_36]
MPIFQDPDRQCGYGEPPLDRRHGEKDAEQLPGGGEREDPGDDYSQAHNGVEAEELSPVDSMDSTNPILETSDREELMQSIKRGESPTWVLNRTLEDYFTNHSDPPQSRVPRPDKTPPLLPAAEIHDSGKHTPKEAEALSSPSEIERPRSALHSGDFREGSPQEQPQQQSPYPFEKQQESRSFGPLGSSPTTPWYTPAAIPPFSRRVTGNEPSAGNSAVPTPISPARSRAPSQGSFSSSYVLKVPTSPLVHQANNTDLDFSPKVDLMDLSSSPDKNNRRRTLPPETFRSLQSSPQGPRRLGTSSRPSAAWRRESTFPYQSHHPRRSLTSAYSLQQATSTYPSYSPQSRRPSYSSDLPPLQHAPMVGSYEESILRGRMSTTPSKPLDFTAQIGVLGRGNCKSNLRCPPHVTVPFPAVFYSYPTAGSGRSISDDSPSPYVGLIDIENSLQKEEPSGTKRRRRHTSPFISQDAHGEEEGRSQRTPAAAQLERRRREKRSRRSQSPKAPPGGCYRIPQQGQLQIIIKNPNKTAVKLFLVPYDLEGMEPGTKTFIRQRSYSAGPIVDIPPAPRSEGPDTPEASDEVMGDPNDKPILRYLIHLNICCPSKGRFYLHSTMRVVFANRVPDGKEKLRNEIQYPEPRYSPYKPNKDSNSSMKSVSDKSFRRRSSGYGLLPGGLLTLDGINHIHPRHSPPFPSMIPRQSPHAFPPNPENMEIGNIPMLPPRFPDLPFQDMSPRSNIISHPSTSEPNLCDIVSSDTYNKLSKGDTGYGGNPFGSPSNGSENGESLLAQRLRSLGVERNQWPTE